MSCNIYEDPDLIVMDDKGRVEMMVDIYDGAGPSDVCRCDGGWRPQRNLPAQRRNPFTAVALLLVLLVVLVLAGITALILLFKILKVDELRAENEQLKEELDGVDCKTGWRRLGCSCYFMSNETKSWADSKRDCEERAAHLVIINTKKENEFVCKLIGAGASWIGLEVIEWKQEPDWRWVDNSEPTNTFWNMNASRKPVPKVKVLTNGGLWEPAYNGSQRWICEQPPS